MERIVRKRVGDYSLSAAAYDSQGDPVVVGGTLGLTVYDGTDTLVGTYTPTLVGFSLRATIPNADIADPQIGTYRGVWSGTIASVAWEAEEHFEIVSGVYFTPDEFRAHVPSLDTAITDDEIADMRSAVEDTFERAAGRAFVTRRATETLDGDGGQLYDLPYPSVSSLVSVTVDGVAITGTIIKFGCAIELPYPVTGTIVVEYLHGMNPSPPQLKRLALIYAETLVGSLAIDARALGQQTEYGYIPYSVAGRGGATGIPEVDAFLSGDRRFGGYGWRKHVVA